ncbi:MAG: hypothetical protein R6U96_10120 [Promethearchaeia archaeon]
MKESITKYKPFIFTKPLIVLLGILSIVFPWARFPEGFSSGEFWLFIYPIIVFSAGYGLSFVFLKNKSKFTKIGLLSK